MHTDVVYLCYDGNKKYYIGSTKDIKNRMKQHKQNYNRKLISTFKCKGDRIKEERQFIDFCKVIGLPLNNIQFMQGKSGYLQPKNEPCLCRCCDQYFASIIEFNKHRKSIAKKKVRI